MNILISLVFLISLTLIQADPTMKELDAHFMYLGNHGKVYCNYELKRSLYCVFQIEIKTKSQGTGRRSESKLEYQWYMSRTDKVDWSKAVAACKTFDMNLAEMNSESAFEVLQGYLSNFHYVHHFYPRAYVGITKPSNSQTWYKASTSQKVYFNLIVNGNPNDITDKRCLIADITSYGQSSVFGSTTCSEANFYICEKLTGEASGVA